jgi:hypothetical protein
MTTIIERGQSNALACLRCCSRAGCGGPRPSPYDSIIYNNEKSTGPLSTCCARQVTCGRFLFLTGLGVRWRSGLRQPVLIDVSYSAESIRWERHGETALTGKAVWHIVKESAKSIGVAKLAPHDLRRTCARLCHASGGEVEQIEFLLGHVSVQTTERYLGCKQRIRSAVNDRIGIEPSP